MTTSGLMESSFCKFKEAASASKVQALTLLFFIVSSILRLSKIFKVAKDELSSRPL